MTPDVQRYSDELLLALRWHDVPGPRIAEALAEVRSHVGETGEDPREAFGEPRAYADEVVAALGSASGATPVWRGVLSWSAAAVGLGAGGGAWLLLEGVTALVADGRPALALPPALLVLLGVVALAATALGLLRIARREDVAVLDPRTGADMTPPMPRWVVPLMVAPVC